MTTYRPNQYKLLFQESKKRAGCSHNAFAETNATLVILLKKTGEGKNLEIMQISRAIRMNT